MTLLACRKLFAGFLVRETWKLCIFWLFLRNFVILGNLYFSRYNSTSLYFAQKHQKRLQHTFSICGLKCCSTNFSITKFEKRTSSDYFVVTFYTESPLILVWQLGVQVSYVLHGSIKKTLRNVKKSVAFWKALDRFLPENPENRFVLGITISPKFEHR